jgi:hypothetical protein
MLDFKELTDLRDAALADWARAPTDVGKVLRLAVYLELLGKTEDEAWLWTFANKPSSDVSLDTLIKAWDLLFPRHETREFDPLGEDYMYDDYWADDYDYHVDDAVDAERQTERDDAYDPQYTPEEVEEEAKDEACENCEQDRGLCHKIR